MVFRISSASFPSPSLPPSQTARRHFSGFRARPTRAPADPFLPPLPSPPPHFVPTSNTSHIFPSLPPSLLRSMAPPRWPPSATARSACSPSTLPILTAIVLPYPYSPPSPTARRPVGGLRTRPPGAPAGLPRAAAGPARRRPRRPGSPPARRTPRLLRTTEPRRAAEAAITANNRNSRTSRTSCFQYTRGAGRWRWVWGRSDVAGGSGVPRT